MNSYDLSLKYRAVVVVVVFFFFLWGGEGFGLFWGFFFFGSRADKPSSETQGQIVESKGSRSGYDPTICPWVSEDADKQA